MPTRCEIDDGEASVAERGAITDPETFAVRTPVRNAVEHPCAETVGIDRAEAGEPGYAAHGEKAFRRRPRIGSRLKCDARPDARSDARDSIPADVTVPRFARR